MHQKTVLRQTIPTHLHLEVSLMKTTLLLDLLESRLTTLLDQTGDPAAAFRAAGLAALVAATQHELHAAWCRACREAKPHP